MQKTEEIEQRASIRLLDRFYGVVLVVCIVFLTIGLGAQNI